MCCGKVQTEFHELALTTLRELLRQHLNVEAMIASDGDDLGPDILLQASCARPPPPPRPRPPTTPRAFFGARMSNINPACMFSANRLPQAFDTHTNRFAFRTA